MARGLGRSSGRALACSHRGHPAAALLLGTSACRVDECGVIGAGSARSLRTARSATGKGDDEPELRRRRVAKLGGVEAGKPLLEDAGAREHDRVDCEPYGLVVSTLVTALVVAG
jgi:hypothetical protein